MGSSGTTLKIVSLRKQLDALKILLKKQLDAVERKKQEIHDHNNKAQICQFKIEKIEREIAALST